MSKVNIPSSITDPFYRYTRPKLIVNVTKKNTKLENIEKIAIVLERDIKDLAKWIKLNIKMNVNIIKEHSNTIISIKNKKHTINFEDVLEKYIEKYILCPVCSNPETIHENDIISCKACGNSQKLLSKISL